MVAGGVFEGREKRICQWEFFGAQVDVGKVAIGKGLKRIIGGGCLEEGQGLSKVVAIKEVDGLGEGEGIDDATSLCVR